LWIGFTVFVLALLALDLGVFHRNSHAVSTREAFTWSVAWISLALIFNACIYQWFGPQRGLEFLTGFLIEKALAVDNIFVFVILFSYFTVSPAFQHKVLFWGIIGALIMRAVFIVIGGVLLQQFHWVMYLFGAFLVLTGIKLLVHQDVAIHPERNPLFRLFTRFVPSTSDYHGDRFFIRQGGRWLATPLLLVLVSVEITDLVFAIDSIPAIFAVTSDPFIVYTSNIFAILGLRSLYFLLAGIIHQFHYLKTGLALVLAFVGMKMLLADIYKVPIGVSLAVIATVLGVAILTSLIWPPDKEELAQPMHEQPAGD